MSNRERSRERRTPTAKGNELARQWGLDVQHALYRETGNWYHQLKRFPGALLDSGGYVIFETEADFKNCSDLQLGKEVHVPCGIKSIQSYVRWTSTEAAALEAVIRPRALAAGQRFSTSAAYRKAVESYAMSLAHKHYSALWPVVRDVSATKSFDLHCLNGDLELRVEVKGTASAGDVVLLTRNEVRHAQCFPDSIALFLVARIEVDSTGCPAGGRVSIFEPWNIAESLLEPIAYQCRLREGSAAQAYPAVESGDRDIAAAATEAHFGGSLER